MATIQPVTFRFTGAAQHVGWIARTWDCEQFVHWNEDASQFALVFVWRKDLSYLRLEGRASSVTHGVTKLPGVTFTSNLRAIRNNLAQMGYASPAFRPDHSYLGALVNQGQKVLLDVCINTDDESFCALARQAVEKDERIRIPFTAMAATPRQEGPTRLGQKRCEIHVMPPEEPQVFDGFLALDLGNTNSSLASLSVISVAIRASEAIQLLPDADYRAPISKQLAADVAPIRSTVRIQSMADVSRVTPEILASHSLDSSEQYLQIHDAFHWCIGAKTYEECETGAEGLVVGPKRLMARSDQAGKWPIQVRLNMPRAKGAGGEPELLEVDSVELHNAVPAELQVCRILQSFRGITKKRIGVLAVTYPTTYSSRELQTLRETVYRGWRRAESAGRENLPGIDTVIPFELDEATAAAFFFLYRRIFESPGGLHRFRYLYPHGFNLLLYDCGGGTTDIALVNATALAHDHLKVTVLGRAGLRDFGGDDITIAVFRLLKAKLAAAVAGAESARASLPQLGKAASIAERRTLLEDYLRQHDREINTNVPTRFDPQSATEADCWRRRTAILLWDWAERVKTYLSANQPIRDAAWDDLAKHLAHNHPSQTKNLLDLMRERVSVTREEVDCLVTEEIGRSIRYCESLVKTKLGEDGRQVDVVAVVGNASRYPLVQDAVKELNVPALKEGDQECFQFEERHLKHAVAKGAALAVATVSAGLGVRVEFDRDVSKRLPFTVAWRNAADGTDNPLFREGETYEDLEPATIEIPSPPPDVPPLQFVLLLCQWPGEKYIPFVRFRFGHGIQGIVTIEYDRDRSRFVAISSDGLRAEEERDIDANVYIPPVQRGEL